MSRGFKLNLLVLALFGVIFFLNQTAAFGDEPMMEPERQGVKRDCLDCHGYPNIKGQEGVRAQRAFCLECHGKESAKRKVEGGEVSLVVKEEYFKGNPHRYVACIECHGDVARSPHSSSRPVTCNNCHPFHSESASMPSHLSVRCEACHFQTQDLRPEPKIGSLVLADKDKQGMPISYSKHAFTKDLGKDLCFRCHTKKSGTSAVDTVLKGKGVLCLACHYSGLGIGSWISGLALIAFFFGLIGTFYLWMKGGVGDTRKGYHEKVSLLSERLWDLLWSKQLIDIIKVFFLDVFLQRRLLKESVKRWFVHTLIYWGLIFKMGLSVITLFAFGLFPNSPIAVPLINKDTALVGFLNDLFGAGILLGILIALLQRLFSESRSSSKEFQDLIGLLLLGGTVAAGFILEGVRFGLVLEMGIEQPWAFLGHLLSKVLSGSEKGFWQSTYAFLWYVHVILWAMVVAWLPLGKLRHILYTPVTLIHEGLKER